MARTNYTFTNASLKSSYQKAISSIRRKEKTAKSYGSGVTLPKIPQPKGGKVTPSYVQKLEELSADYYSKVKVQVTVPITGKTKTVSYSYAKQLAREKKSFERKYYKEYFNPETGDASKYRIGRQPSGWYESGTEVGLYINPISGGLQYFPVGKQPKGWIDYDSYIDWVDINGAEYYINELRNMCKDFVTEESKEAWLSEVDSAISDLGKEVVAQIVGDGLEDKNALKDIRNWAFKYSHAPNSTQFIQAISELRTLLHKMPMSVLESARYDREAETGEEFNDYS